MSFKIKHILGSDNERYEGVPKINIYLLRLVFVLMLLFLGRDSWSQILSFEGTWDPEEAAAWSIWASYSVLSLIGIVRPLKMLPLLMLEIIYKGIWLIVVAYPLWSTNQLVGSSAEKMTFAFLWVVLPIAAMPWKYVWKNYLFNSKDRKAPGLISEVLAHR